MTENTDVAALDEPMGQSDLPEVKLFGKWSLDEVYVSDISLVVRSTFRILNIHPSKSSRLLISHNIFSDPCIVLNECCR